jgi:hypothetical protein
MLRVPKYRASLVDLYREHLRKRRAEDPAVPVKHLLEEIKTLGFTGCLNLLHKYINQGRADADRSHISPRRLARMLLTRPDNLKAEQQELLARFTAACPEMTQLATVISDFAPLPAPHADNADALSRRIVQLRGADLPHRGRRQTTTHLRWERHAPRQAGTSRCGPGVWENRAGEA